MNTGSNKDNERPTGTLDQPVKITLAFGAIRYPGIPLAAVTAAPHTGLSGWLRGLLER